MTFHSLDTTALALRRLRYALVASLVLHLLILWPGTTHILTKDTPSVLSATLHTPSRPVTEAGPPTPPRAVPPAPTLEQPAPRTESLSLESPRPDSVPQALAVPAAPVSKPVPDSSRPAAARFAPVLAAGLSGDSLLTETNASADAADGLRGYRLAVATQARRFKRYPPQAMASGWEGTADIRVEVGGDGQPRPATLTKSSGRELLDRAALAMIDAGALRARLPESLRGKNFAVVLPVVFDLEDE